MWFFIVHELWEPPSRQSWRSGNRDNIVGKKSEEVFIVKHSSVQQVSSIFIIIELVTVMDHGCVLNVNNRCIYETRFWYTIYNILSIISNSLIIIIVPIVYLHNLLLLLTLDRYNSWNKNNLQVWNNISFTDVFIFY